MYFQYFIIGIKLVFSNIMRRIHNFKRKCIYYLRPNRRDWVNWQSVQFERDMELLEQVFQKEDVQLYYVDGKHTKSRLSYYMSCYITLIDNS